MSQAEPLDQLARRHTAKAVETLAEIMHDGFAEDRDRIRAAESILDRGHGKPLAATIQIPMNQRQAKALMGLSDGELLDIIREPLPQIGHTSEGDYEEVPLADDPLLR
jgi:hypothetical protein